MYLVVIAWVYVVLLMGLAEALSPQGTVLGAIITVLLYGLLPLSIVVYILGTPSRRRARAQEDAQALAAMRAAETTPPAEPEQNPATEAQASSAILSQPDHGSHAPGAAVHAAVTAVRKEQ